ncbi:MAG: T9SS type A sorting domain-containing protein, partial [Bacteroidota bacterium]
VKQGEWLNVEAEGAVRLDVYDLAGKLCTAVPVVEAGEHVKLDIQQGAYLVKVSRDKTFTLKKLIVW